MASKKINIGVRVAWEEKVHKIVQGMGMMLNLDPGAGRTFSIHYRGKMIYRNKGTVTLESFLEGYSIARKIQRGDV